MKHIVYTHTDYKDIWPMYFGQTKKYFPNAEKIVFVNRKDADLSLDHQVILYDDKLTYRERVLSCLNQLNTDYIIYHHEDMILYDKPYYDRLINYISKISSQTNRNFIKLIRGGLQIGKPDNEYPELREIDSNFEYVFAIQPSIWAYQKFKEVFEHSKGNTIWEFEVAASQTCRDRNIYGWYVDDGGIQRGRYHWDSKVYPYIATAVVKSKWNVKEYSKDLNKLYIEYNIDPTIRGTN